MASDSNRTLSKAYCCGRRHLFTAFLVFFLILLVQRRHERLRHLETCSFARTLLGLMFIVFTSDSFFPCSFGTHVWTYVHLSIVSVAVIALSVTVMDEMTGRSKREENGSLYLFLCCARSGNSAYLL
jgi:hypothetical protein